ncbi:hypothetical protein EK21DRAFT_116311 [Setomelanomma holmii]|uniref:Uncharacterized protein n=1 Tax=Setomelanomma holmii TaxID=210430 RepID=A0A9P4H158_9PLEO|nr:hypothetical protein EK21DRAFT_116311 [Setomelanomma holmii]
MAFNPKNPKWEDGCAVHYSTLGRLDLLGIPNFCVARDEPSPEAVEFPPSSFRCAWSWCPLCLPPSPKTERNVDRPLSAPTAPVPTASTNIPAAEAFASDELRAVRHVEFPRQRRAMRRRKLANKLATKTSSSSENLALHVEKCKASKDQTSMGVQGHDFVSTEEKVEGQVLRSNCLLSNMIASWKGNSRY